MKIKNKSIVIKVEDTTFGPTTGFSKEGPFIYDWDCQHIIDNLNRDTEITVEELNHALDVVTVYFVENCINGLVLDINERNKILAPAKAKEMTIDEIEKELGYKIKIVKENKKND